MTYATIVNNILTCENGFQEIKRRRAFGGQKYFTGTANFLQNDTVIAVPFYCFEDIYLNTTNSYIMIFLIEKVFV